MTHHEKIVAFFKARNGFATLGEILRSGEPWVWEGRARFDGLRRKGYQITCNKGKSPSENLYRLIPPTI